MFADAISLDALDKKPPISLSQAKNNIETLMRDEFGRHETVLEVASSIHEASIRLENEFHISRLAELDKIIDMLDKRIEKRKQ